MEIKKSKLTVDELFASIKKKFDESPKNESINRLVLGEYGTGKSLSLLTADKPVLVHSFDPGGCSHIMSLEKDGIMVDNTFENIKNFGKFESEFTRLERSGIFNEIGTYVIDSLSMFSEAVMHATIEKSSKVKDGIPMQRDYLIQMITITEYIRKCASFPCNFIATGHLEIVKDEDTGIITYVPLMTGKLKERLPLLFDEVYIATAVNNKYTFLAGQKGRLKGRSRLRGTNPLMPIELPQDYQAIKKMAKAR